MLTLSIVRHAKSSWGDADLRDIDRPLNKRGKRQAQRLGAHLSKLALAPDLILCSPAKRACQTLARMMKGWQHEAEQIIDNRLYLASSGTILSLLEELGKARTHIMVIGHNPGLHMLSHSLAARGNPEELALLREKYPTATFSTIRARTEQWKKFGKVGGKLIYLVPPRQLAN